MAETLDRISPGWRNDYVLQLDNCASHKTMIVRTVIANLRIPTIFSVPASFIAAPVERVFTAIKMKDYQTI